MRCKSVSSAAASDARTPLAATTSCSSAISFSIGARIVFCKSSAAVVMASGSTLAAFMLTSLPKSMAVLIPVSSPAITPTACRRCLLATSEAILAASADIMAFLPPAAANDRSTLCSALAFLNNLADLRTAAPPAKAVPTTPSLSNQSDKPSHVCSSPVATSCTSNAACQSVTSQLSFKSLYKPDNHSPFSSLGCALNAACK